MKNLTLLIIAHEELGMLGMSEHISVCGKNKTPDLFITPFYKVKRDSEELRMIMEEHFITKFKPKLNNLSLSNNKTTCLWKAVLLKILIYYYSSVIFDVIATIAT